MGDWQDSAEVRLHLECYRLSFGEWWRAVLAGECPYGMALSDMEASFSALRFASVGVARNLTRHSAPPLLPLTKHVSKAPIPFSLPAAVARLEGCWEQAQRSYARAEAGGLDPLSLYRIAQQIFREAAGRKRSHHQTDVQIRHAQPELHANQLQNMCEDLRAKSFDKEDES